MEKLGWIGVLPVRLRILLPMSINGGLKTAADEIGSVPMKEGLKAAANETRNVPMERRSMGIPS
jgi:hypothetical protein